MKALIAAANTASLSLLGASVAYAGAPEYFKIPAKWWMLVIVILLILNLLCCWRKR